MKELTSKRSKTDSDYEMIANLEWLSCWYYEDGLIELALNKNGNSIVIGEHGKLVIPAYVLDSLIVNGAKKNKLGMQFKSGVFVESDADLILEPQKSLSEMFADKNFRLTTLETVNKAKVVRTRPYMKNWKAKFAVNYDDTVVNAGQIEQSLEMAGRLVGLCERRPRYGRFTYELN